MSNPQQLVQKLWNYCNILRDDGLSYGDYDEQLTFLLFLKMADERSKPAFSRSQSIRRGHADRDGSGETDEHFGRVGRIGVSQLATGGIFAAIYLAEGIFGAILHSARWTAFVQPAVVHLNKLN